MNTKQTIATALSLTTALAFALPSFAAESLNPEIFLKSKTPCPDAGENQVEPESNKLPDPPFQLPLKLIMPQAPHPSTDGVSSTVPKRSYDKNWVPTPSRHP